MPELYRERKEIKMKVMKSLRWQIFAGLLVVVLAVFASHMDAQKAVTVQGFDPTNGIRSLSGEVQSLQTQMTGLQAKLNVAGKGGKITWIGPINGMRTSIASMQTSIRDLNSYYRRISNLHGVRLSTDLATSLNSLSATLDRLGNMSGTPDAQVSVNGINTSITRLNQLVISVKLTSPQGITQGEAEANF